MLQLAFSHLENLVQIQSDDDTIVDLLVTQLSGDFLIILQGLFA